MSKRSLPRTRYDRPRRAGLPGPVGPTSRIARRAEVARQGLHVAVLDGHHDSKVARLGLEGAARSQRDSVSPVNVTQAREDQHQPFRFGVLKRSNTAGHGLVSNELSLIVTLQLGRIEAMTVCPSMLEELVAKV